MRSGVEKDQEKAQNMRKACRLTGRFFSAGDGDGDDALPGEWAVCKTCDDERDRYGVSRRWSASVRHCADFLAGIYYSRRRGGAARFPRAWL
jgi:hypothetical protein